MYELPHLVVAAKQDDLPMCEFLLMHGCDVNRTDNDQVTRASTASLMALSWCPHRLHVVSRVHVALHSAHNTPPSNTCF